MKKLNNYSRSLMILLFATVIFASCKKGDTGPSGPKGDSGIQGPVGLTGAAGQDGQVILSGTTAPGSAVGKTGDFYLNKTSSDFYGPKTTAGWGTPTNLKGSTGATGAKGATGATGVAGAAGSVILSGSTIPAATIGKNGDYYLYTTVGLFYGPKNGTDWGTPLNLKGPKGDKGDPGNANIISTGWKTIGAIKWNSGYGAGAVDLGQPGDLDAYYASPVTISEAEASGGVVFVYAQLPEHPNSASPLPIKYTYTSFGDKGVVELRFAYGTTPQTAHWVYIGAVLTSGTWNKISEPMKNTYLNKIQFCVVHMPASSIAQVPASTFSDYRKVKSAFHLTD